MNAVKVRAALEEARRFIERCDTFLIAEGNKPAGYYSNPKEAGAVRRSSMDLTRSLAELRKPY